MTIVNITARGWIQPGRMKRARHPSQLGCLGIIIVLLGHIAIAYDLDVVLGLMVIE